MQTRLLLTATFAAATQLAAQSFTSPAGVETTEGTETFAMFGTNRRLQGIDNTIPGPIANINSIAFRRDGLSTSTAGAARTIDVEVLMGVGNFATRSSNWANNYTASTVVVATRNVNFPNWVPAPPTPPAPFDFLIPFDAPWSYPGGQALIWEIKCSNASVTSNAVQDRHGWSSTLGVGGTMLGTGCTATGRTAAYGHTLTLIDPGPAGNMTLRYAGSNAPASAPTVLHLDFSDANLSLPGLLCGSLRSLGGLAAITTPTPSATGTIATQNITFPYSAFAVGLPIVSQLISVDAGQAPANLPVALSNGRAATMPAYLEVGYVWSTSTTNATGTFIDPGTIPVTQFTY